MTYYPYRARMHGDRVCHLWVESRDPGYVRPLCAQYAWALEERLDRDSTARSCKECEAMDAGEPPGWYAELCLWATRASDYMDHLDGCVIHDGDDMHCDCGLADLLAEVKMANRNRSNHATEVEP